MQQIDDGYNFTKTLPEVAFVPGQVAITFRPAAGASHRAFSRALMGPVAEATAVGAGIIAAGVKEWNLRRRDGKWTTDQAGGTPVPVTAEEASKLPSSLFTEILDTLFGFAGSDEAAASLKN